MSHREWRQRVKDIVGSIDEITSFVAGLSLSEFADDAKTMKAVLADFAIIGEAAAHVPPDVQEANPGIAWRSMREMRNVIVHVYFAVNPRIVWDTIQHDLPALRAQLRALLDSATED